MSEPKLISPLLDNFVMGDRISEHGGVSCCPAINKDTDEKYIVKIISVPASQVQLDALLLSGAYSDKGAAVSYFKSIADSIADEAEILQKLAQFEGFMPIEAWQIEPMDDGNGYDIYLLSAYRSTLRHQLRRSSMTHLQALNLGLDLCAALAVSRRMGYLYADLKPANVYLSGTQEYRIGDLGFISLASLQYASLPERYRSAYTAPEIADAFSSLNTTIDIYAVGLILYQVFNDGQLPFKDGEVPTESFSAPAYADYEMAEIILKACAIDPAQRWQDPVEMGQAIVNYMQRNGAHDTPIVPVPVTEDSVTEPAPDEATEGRFEEHSVPEEEADATGETDPGDAADTQDEETTVDPEATEILEADEAPLPEDIPEDTIYSEDSEGNLTFIEGTVDETMEEHDSSEIEYDEVTEEVSDMLQQADELIAHEAPAPVVQPEPIDVPVPPAIDPKEVVPADSETEESVTAETENTGNADEPSDEPCDTDDSEIDTAADEVPDVAQDADEDGNTTTDMESDEDEEEEPLPAKRKHYGWILWVFAVIAAAALIFAGFYGYKNYYLQSIDELTLTAGESGSLTVNIVTTTDENDLTVICTDTYGIQKSAAVVNGKAEFTDLLPNSAYNLKVIISGFHKLTGKTTISYATPAQTEILQFTAVTGAEDGSVILSFTHSGPEPEIWCITYTTPNGVEEKIEFTGRLTTIPNLQIGEEYTFTLDTEADTSITGINTVTHVAKKIITPENLLVTGCIDGKLTASWSVAEDAAVENWTVRCYNNTFDQTLVVDTCSVSIEVPDVTDSYTLEVKASGMSISARTDVAENSLTVKDFTVDPSTSGKLKLSWTPTGEAPADGWILRYGVDNSSLTQISVSEGNSVEIEPVVPGSKYTFELLTTENTAVLGGKHIYNTEAPAAFSGYDVTASNMIFKMCKTPGNDNWDRYDLSDSDYTTTFTAGEKASFLIRLTHSYDRSNDVITTLFVIRDESGSIVDISASSSTWLDMWYKNYCELDIPDIPQVPGDYTVSIYFNGAFANTTKFTVTE